MPERKATREADPEAYGSVLDEFDDFDPKDQTRIHPRRSLLAIARNFTLSGRGVAKAPVTPVKQSQKSDQSERSGLSVASQSTSSEELATSAIGSGGCEQFVVTANAAPRRPDLASGHTRHDR